jgi:hypothetical protein
MGFRAKSLASSLLFLLVSNKCSKLADFAVDFFVEVKPVLFPVSYLKQVVVQGFLGDSDLIGGSLERPLNIGAVFVIEASVELPPEGNLFYNFPDFFFLLLVVLILFSVLILDPLLLNQGLCH